MADNRRTIRAGTTHALHVMLNIRFTSGYGARHGRAAPDSAEPRPAFGVSGLSRAMRSRLKTRHIRRSSAWSSLRSPMRAPVLRTLKYSSMVDCRSQPATTVFAVSVSALHLSARGRWVGWDAATRRAHFHRVVGLSLFRIRPWISCRNLAPHGLGQLFRRLAVDFEARYGYAPWPVETFVDGVGGASWAAVQFGGPPLGGAHLVTVEGLMGEDPMTSFSAAAKGNRARIKACYRFIDQLDGSAVTPEGLPLGVLWARFDAPSRQSVIPGCRKAKTRTCVRTPATAVRFYQNSRNLPSGTRFAP